MIHGSAPRDIGRSEPKEIEWQFDAIDLRPVERWLREHVSKVDVRSNGRPSEQIDIYADTEDWRLHRAGYSLRIRRRSGAFEAALKSRTDARDGLRTRTELNVAMPTGTLSDVTRLDHPLGRTVGTIIGRHELRPVVEVRTRRTTYELTLGEDRVGEVALDATTIPVDRREEPVRLQRVEVEVPPGAVADVRPFVESLKDACGLMPAPMSKADVGLFAVGRSPSDALDFGPIDVNTGMSTGEVAFAILRGQFRILMEKEAGTRLREDVEELHEMRVATRRLRAALGLFSEALPVRAARFRDEFGWLGECLGRVRDLDVQLDHLDRWEGDLPEPDRQALQVLRRLWEDDRAAAEADLRSRLDSARYDRLVASFSALLRRGPLRRSAASKVPILVSAPDILSRRYRKVRRAGSSLGSRSAPDAYHRLRIDAKRFRYALEFVGPIYGNRAKKLIKRLATVQEVLGEHQDAQVAIGRLRSLVDRLGEPSPATVFVMGGIAERYTLRVAELRRAFPKALAAVRPRWRSLRAQMEARREALGWRSPAPRPTEPAQADLVRLHDISNVTPMIQPSG